MTRGQTALADEGAREHRRSGLHVRLRKASSAPRPHRLARRRCDPAISCPPESLASDATPGRSQAGVLAHIHRTLYHVIKPRGGLPGSQPAPAEGSTRRDLILVQQRRMTPAVTQMSATLKTGQCGTWMKSTT
jgi:hypothetical protein